MFEKPVCLKHCKKQRQDGSVYKNVFPYNLFEKKINFLIKASSDEGRKGIREWQYQNEDLVVFKVQVIPHLLPMQLQGLPCGGLCGSPLTASGSGGGLTAVSEWLWMHKNVAQECMETARTPNKSHAWSQCM